MSPDQQLLEFWRKVIDPAGVGMPEAISEELGSFTGESIEIVRQRMAVGLREFREKWAEAGVDPSNETAVTEFYRNHFIEAYELANWHCGLTNEEPPLGYARVALFAQARGLKRALDFGSGIGTGSLALAAADCEVHSADIANQLLQFVGHRFIRRGLQPTLIDLCTSARPKARYYDVITCFDVLEHVPDQLAKLRELEGYLRPGGYLFVNLMEDSTHEERPMHISSAGPWLRLVRKTGLVPAWNAFAPEYKALQLRSRLGRVRNALAAVSDRMQGL